jgi:hypothetical protein
MKLMNIRLELGRTDGFPEGSSRHGFEFVAPLTPEGHLDSQAWAKAKDRCTVRQFWEGRDDEYGFLRHVGQGWRFDYDPSDREDDEPFFKLDRHVIAPGLYVSVKGHDGVQRPYKIISVSPARTDA